jgi:predicted ATP-binding protein involved in virulence
LSNWKNKARLITFIQKGLTDVGVTVIAATSDADRLIAQTTVDFSRAQERNYVTVAEGTDVLVLLVALAGDSAQRCTS